MIDKNYKPLLNNIKSFVFDMDGVFTDNSVIIDNEGNRLRNMNMKDNFAVHHATNNSYKVAIISRGKSKSLHNLFIEIGVQDVHLGIVDKLETLKEFSNLHNLKPQNILYMGDDLPDMACVQYAGFGCCPQDAAPEIKSISNYISHLKGGEGCVRDVIRQVMKLQGAW